MTDELLKAIKHNAECLMSCANSRDLEGTCHHIDEIFAMKAALIDHLTVQREDERSLPLA
jgi:hypothetical protein